MQEDYVWRVRIQKAVETVRAALHDLVQSDTSSFEQFTEDWQSTFGISEFGLAKTVGQGLQRARLPVEVRHVNVEGQEFAIVRDRRNQS